jgi:hypothetical protein
MKKATFSSSRTPSFSAFFRRIATRISSRRLDSHGESPPEARDEAPSMPVISLGKQSLVMATGLCASKSALKV